MQPRGKRRHIGPYRNSPELARADTLRKVDLTRGLVSISECF